MKPKNQATTLDDLDWHILRLLQENAKQTYTEIGTRLKVAHSTVYDRIQKMEEQGFIKKYEAVIDYDKMGIQQITALMTITTDPRETENIANKMTKYDQVLEVSTSISDTFIVGAKVVAKNQADLHTFVAKSIAPLPGVLRIRTAIVTRKCKEERFCLPTDELIGKRKE
jgi:Lrp/AsnC family leucine-responsive transcriptional regulator